MCKEYATVEKKTGNFIRIYDEREVAEHVTALMGNEFELIELEDLDDGPDFDFDDVCYECTGYGDDYRYDAETDDLVCNCDDCPFNEANQDDD